MTLATAAKQGALIGALALLLYFSVSALGSLAAEALSQDQTDNLTQWFEDGWVEDARDRLVPQVKEHPKDALLRYQLAQAYLWLKEYDLADKQSRKCIDLVDDNVEYQILRGHILGLLARHGSKLKAISRANSCRKAYEVAATLDPQNVEAREALMIYHMVVPGFAGGKKDRARQQAEAIFTIDPMHGYFARAQILQHLDKDSAGARGEYQAAIVNFGEDSEPCFEYAGFLNLLKETREAIRHYEMGIARDENPVGALITLGYLLMDADRPEQAIDAFERALILDPREISATVFISQVYLKDKKYQRSQAILTEALRENPNSAYVLFQEGVLLYKMGKNLPKAEANIRQYLGSRLNLGWESRPSALYQLAKVMEAQGKYTEAWELAKEASKLEPYNGFLKSEAQKMKFMGNED